MVDYLAFLTDTLMIELDDNNVREYIADSFFLMTQTARKKNTT